MIQIKRLLSLAIVLLTTQILWAQSNGSNSSYSRFGLGTMNDQSQGWNKGMGGTAQGLRDGGRLNIQNPASYTAIDSLAFIFDVGMGIQQVRMSGNGSSVNAVNASLEYVTAGFRLRPGLGMSIGFVPYSTIGYNFTNTGFVGISSTSMQTITSRKTYYGNGGLHEMFMGIGWNPFANFCIGANVGYVWGTYNHSLAQTFYEGSTISSNYNTQNEAWDSDIKTYKLDFGVQYPIVLNKSNKLTLGATASIGHTIGSEVSMIRYTSLGDTLESKVKKAFEMPYTMSAGAAWQHKEKITLAADYTIERWKGCKVPVSLTTPTSSSIQIATDQYYNRHKISVGAEYMQNPLGRRYGQLIRYRLGASFATPNVKVNDMKGPREYSLTAGVALPLTTRSRSLINVSAQWLRRVPSSSSLITENYLMLHLGVTFNESWFMKWRFQ